MSSNIFYNHFQMLRLFSGHWLSGGNRRSGPKAVAKRCSKSSQTPPSSHTHFFFFVLKYSCPSGPLMALQ